jgi:hypothetical protein
MLLSTDQCAVHSKNTTVLRKQKIMFKVITPTTLYLQTYKNGFAKCDCAGDNVCSKDDNALKLTEG